MMAIAQPEREHDTKSRILDAAAHLFVDSGYESTTMKLIAKRVGITPGALYWHFPSKEAILFEFLEWWVAEIREFVEVAIGNGSSPLNRVRAFARAQVVAQLRVRSDQHGIAMYGVMHLADVLPEEQKQIIVEAQRRHVWLLREIITEGVADGTFRSSLDPTPTAFAILTMCDFVTVWYRLGGRLSVEDIGDVYSDLAAAMVSALPLRP